MGKTASFVAVVMAWMMIQTGSLIYELFEWLLTIVMTAEEADYYNGQQGDMWDAQKDMALAPGWLYRNVLGICGSLSC